MDAILIRVRALGLGPHELNALKSVCRLSQQTGRPIGHELADPGGAADIFVVAMDDAQAVADWRARDPQTLIPFVAAGSSPAGAANGVHLPKPLLASRLLAAMDACANLRKGTDPVDTPAIPSQAQASPSRRSANAGAWATRRAAAARALDPGRR